ncbi:DUF397 domain-containing protein [Actinoplanes sp. HUAS TT8]|uniref:DUF397 domain-containing protein n=1 Tax=Actinoplanes sp. HUAS TT8 TaxID=3447453 RepID=UPI003F51E0AF
MTDSLSWQTSSHCTNGACVAVAFSGDSVLVRDTKTTNPPFVYTVGEWRDFIAGVKGGEFDA